MSVNTCVRVCVCVYFRPYKTLEREHAHPRVISPDVHNKFYSAVDGIVKTKLKHIATLMPPTTPSDTTFVFLTPHTKKCVALKFANIGPHTTESGFIALRVTIPPIKLTLTFRVS